MNNEADFVKGQSALLAGAAASVPTVEGLLQWAQLVLVCVSVGYAVHKWRRSLRQEGRETRLREGSGAAGGEMDRAEARRERGGE